MIRFGTRHGHDRRKETPTEMTRLWLSARSFSATSQWQHVA